MTEKLNAFREEIRKVADGKISCDCGNTNWEQFIYVSAGKDYYTAGCKKCGTCHAYKNGEWKVFARP